LLYIKQYKKKVVEKFRVKDMDKVLDKYCIDTKGIGFDNYLGPWPGPEFTEGKAQCGFYNCPMESCWVLERDSFNSANRFAYKYVMQNGMQNRVSSTAYNEDGDQIETTSCETKDNPDSNVYCGVKPAECNRTIGNTEVYHFNSSRGHWEKKYVNYFMNSNGNCYLRDVNNYAHVKILDDMKENVVINDDYNNLNTSDPAEISYYLNKGPSCSVRLESSGEYYNDKDELINVTRDKYEGYELNSKSFRCKDINLIKYGYKEADLNTPLSGFNCGLYDDVIKCSNCTNSVDTCFIFDSDSREYKKQVALTTLFDKPDWSIIRNCEKYIVNESFSNVVENLSYNRLQFGSNFSDTELDRWIGQGTLPPKKFKNCESNIDEEDADFGAICTNLNKCQDSKPETCSPQQYTCATNYENMPQYVRDVYAVPDSSIPPQNKFYDINYKRFWGADGINCEYCVVNTNNNNCINSESNLTSMVCPDISYTCPIGLEFKTSADGLTKYCDYCPEKTYYDVDTSNCLPLEECGAGFKFDPINKITPDFPVQNIVTQSEEISRTPDNIGIQNELKVTILDNTKYAYLNNGFNEATNTSTICTACDEPNTYMSDRNHTNYNCTTCLNKIGWITAVNTDKTACVNCVKVNGYTEKNGTNGTNVIQYETNGQRVCSKCPPLPTTDVHAKYSDIVSSSSGDGFNGTCYRKCRENNTDPKIQISGSYKAYDTTTYPLCEFTCGDNYKKNTANGSCEACLVGTERAFGSPVDICTPCDAGTFNSTPGEPCVNCPPIGSSRSGISSPHASTLITQCKFACVGTTPIEYAEYKVALNGYDTTMCTPKDCFSGFKRENIVTGENSTLISGYSYKENPGKINKSVSQICVPIDTVNVVDQLPSDCLSTHSKHNDLAFQQVCCRDGTSYTPGSGTSPGYCDCPTTPATLPQYATSVSYDNVINGCKPTCGGDSEPNPVDNRSCILNCRRHQYKDGSSCEPCYTPVAGDNVISVYTNFVNGGEFKSDCVNVQCDDGYSPLTTTDSSGIITFSCTADEYDCEHWDDVGPDFTTTEIYKTMSPITTPVTPSPVLQRKQTTSLTPDECRSAQAIDNTSNCTEPNANGTLRACCSGDGIATLKRELNQMDTNNPGFMINPTYSYEKQIAYCCTGSDIGRATINNNETSFGCCPPNEHLYVNGTNKKCCPLPSPDTHEVYSIDAGVGACTKSCKPGYVLDSNRCIQVNYCNPYLYEDYTNNQTKGYVSYYNKDDVSNTLGTNTCPVGVDESLKTRDGCTTIRKNINGVGKDFTYCCSENDIDFEKGFVYDRVSDTCRKLCDNNNKISNIIEYQDIHGNEIQKRTPIETPKYYKSVASKATDCATNSFEECKPNYADITFDYASLYSNINTGGSTTQASDFVSYDIIDNITNEVTTVTNLASSGASTNPSDNDNIDRTEIKICSRVTKDCYENLRNTQDFNDNGNYYRFSNVDSICTGPLACTSENSSCPTGYLETNASEITNALSCPVPVEGELITCTTGINLIGETGDNKDIVKCYFNNRYIPSLKRCVNSSSCSPILIKQDDDNIYGVNTYTYSNVIRNDSGACSPSSPTTIEYALSVQSRLLNVDTNCIGIPDSGTIPYTAYKCCSDYTKGKPHLATNNTYTCDKVWTSKFNEIDYAGYEDEAIITKTLITSDLANSMGITDGEIPS
jgi:hypothetical protein